jgi:hypothetical protein
MEFKWNTHLASKKFEAKVLAKRWSNLIYNTTPKFREWLTINHVIYVTFSKVKNYEMITSNFANQELTW